MKIVHIERTKYVKKTKKELEEERKGSKGFLLIDTEKRVPLKEPIYIVEMTAKEVQLVSFYLELEGRKPIVNIELDTKLGGEKK
jgi:hypothetical protein